MFSKTWLCHHSSKNKVIISDRNTNCKAVLKIIIKKVTKHTLRSDKFLKHDLPLTAEVTIGLQHLHSTTSAASLKFLRVNEEVFFFR